MWVGGWSRGGLDDTPPRATWFHPSPRSMCSAERLTAGLSERQVRLRRRFFGCYPALALQGLPSPPSTLLSHGSSLCGFPTATALRLFPRGRASTGDLDAPASDAPGCVSAVALRVAEALAALTLQGSLWSHVRLHRHSQAAEFGE